MSNSLYSFYSTQFMSNCFSSVSQFCGSWETVGVDGVLISLSTSGDATSSSTFLSLASLPCLLRCRLTLRDRRRETWRSPPHFSRLTKRYWSPKIWTPEIHCRTWTGRIYANEEATPFAWKSGYWEGYKSHGWIQKDCNYNEPLSGLQTPQTKGLLGQSWKFALWGERAKVPI